VKQRSRQHTAKIIVPISQSAAGGFHHWFRQARTDFREFSGHADGTIQMTGVHSTADMIGFCQRTVRQTAADLTVQTGAIERGCYFYF